MTSQLRSAASKAGDLARRTVHVKLFPTASTFAERQEVLRILERFGEVTWFKSLKHDARTPVPNAFLSLFAREDNAQALIDASPIRYRLIQEAPPSPTSDSSSAPPSPPPEKDFELRANFSTYPHAARISTSPLHGPWTPRDGVLSRVIMDLWERVPAGVAHDGMCDWEAERRLGYGEGRKRESNSESKEERDARRKLGVTKEGWGASGVPWRITRRKRNEAMQAESMRGG